MISSSSKSFSSLKIEEKSNNYFVFELDVFFIWQNEGLHKDDADVLPGELVLGETNFLGCFVVAEFCD